MAHLKQDPQRIYGLAGPVTHGERNIIQVDVHTPEVGRTASGQYIMVERKTGETTQVRTACVINSSRWTDVETRHLLEIWGTRYSSLKCKKRNFKDWEIISGEFNNRCQMNGSLGLGPRTGAQCKIRIKNIVADYKRTKGEYPGQNSRQLFPFFDTIDGIINKSEQHDDSNQLSGELDEQEAKEDNSVTLQLPAEVQVMERPEVSLATATVTTPATTVVASPVVATGFAGPSMVLSSFRSTNAINMPPNHLSLSALHTHGMHTLHEPDQRNGYATSHSVLDSSKPYKTGMVQKKKLRKNPRPFKVVKVTRQAKDDEKLLTIVREFMDERRKREEELFDRLFQQQAEAEKRYQEFTLNVIKEIGRLFRPEASGK